MLQQLFTNFALSDGVSGSTSSRLSDEDAGAVILGMLIFWFFILIISYVVTSLLTMIIFKKAGVSLGKAWIPIYRNWVQLQIGGQQGFWCVVPFVGRIFQIIAIYHINMKLGKSGGLFALYIFAPLIWYIIIAVDGSQWNDTLGPPRQDTPDQLSYGGYQSGYPPQQPSYDAPIPNNQPPQYNQPQPPQNYGPQPPQYNQPQPPQNYGPQPPQNYGPQGYYGDPNQQPAPQDYNQQNSQGGYNLNGPVQEPAKKPRSTGKKKI